LCFAEASDKAKTVKGPSPDRTVLVQVLVQLQKGKAEELFEQLVLKLRHKLLLLVRMHAAEQLELKLKLVQL